MTDLTLTFPVMPTDADKSIIKPSRAFRRSIYKVIAAIISFVLVYIISLAFAVGVAIAMGWFGVFLISELYQFLVLVFALGLILSGIMLCFFLVKFIFAKSRPAVTPGYEVTRDEQPELFAFIDQVTAEVGTRRPKHVYITPEVNASASFKTTFWSMFFPIRKDLNIGLGLINGINQSEFKSVLAHEFGHFSQKSMRFGSYVNNLNRALYNLLYENNGYYNAINSVARTHSVIRVCFMINIYIIKGIQAVLKKVYIFINKSYMQLSREMEFHADTIAAYASGSNNVVSSLRRIEAADECYNQMFTLLNSNFAENKRSADMYQLQLMLLKQYANANKLSTDKSGLPVFDRALSSLQNSQLSFNSQWASHPLIEDREENVNRYALTLPVVVETAWGLFRNAEELKQHFTDKVYLDIEEGKELTVIANEEIEADFIKELDAASFDEQYKGYYDLRALTQFDTAEAITNANANNSFSSLFTDDNCNLSKSISTLKQDLASLEYLIATPGNDIRSFDYQGIKHYPADAFNVKIELKAELKAKETKLAQLDQDIFLMFYHAASTPELKKQLTDLYENVFKYQTDAVTDYDNYNNLMQSMQPVYGQMPYSQIYDVVNNVYDLEKDAKPRITHIMNDETSKPFITKEQQDILDKYLNNKWIYFSEPRYDKNALSAFNNALTVYIDIIHKRNFQYKKDLFDFQLTLNP